MYSSVGDKDVRFGEIVVLQVQASDGSWHPADGNASAMHAVWSFLPQAVRKASIAEEVGRPSLTEMLRQNLAKAGITDDHFVADTRLRWKENGHLRYPNDDFRGECIACHDEHFLGDDGVCDFCHQKWLDMQAKKAAIRLATRSL